MCPNSDNPTEGRWLHGSSNQCIYITTISPTTASVTEVAELHLTIPQLPIRSSYSCVFLDLNWSSPAEIWYFGARCVSPDFKRLGMSLGTEGFRTVTLALNSSETGKLFVTKSFTFYNCSNFKSCSQCTASAFDCHWCVYDNGCYHDTMACQSNIIAGISSTKPGRKGAVHCPRIDTKQTEAIYLPVGVPKMVLLKGYNFPQLKANLPSYKCVVNTGSAVYQATAKLLDDRHITCSMPEMYYSDNQGILAADLSVYWGDDFYLESSKGLVALLYKCDVLANEECSLCMNLNYTRSYLECYWCDGRCSYMNRCDRQTIASCPAPQILNVWPLSGPIQGGTNVTIDGRNLGSKFEDIQDAVFIANVQCKPFKELYSPSRRIVCQTQWRGQIYSGPVEIRLTNGAPVKSSEVFHYRSPLIEEIEPENGPMAGGSRITIKGQDLNTGGQLKAVLGDAPCIVDRETLTPTSVVCQTTRVWRAEPKSPIQVFFDGARITLDRDFIFREDPIITDIHPLATIREGGRMLTIRGTNLGYIQQPEMFAFVPMEGGEFYPTESTTCKVINLEEIRCPSPPLDPVDNPTSTIIRSRRRRHTQAHTITEVIHRLRNHHQRSARSLSHSEEGLLRRSLRSVAAADVEKSRASASDQKLLRVKRVEPINQAQLGFIMDGVLTLRNLSAVAGLEASLKYYPNPRVYNFSESDSIKVFKGEMLIIEGVDLTLAADKADVKVWVGSEPCNVTLFSPSQIACDPPPSQPAGIDVQGNSDSKVLPLVVVKVNNMRYTVGRVEYDVPETFSFPTEAIAGIAAGGGFLLLVIILILIIYRRQSTRAERIYHKLQIQLDNLESNVRNECKQAFAELQTDMTDLTGDLVSSGIPFWDYHTYTFKVLFPGLTNHVILHPPMQKNGSFRFSDQGLQLFHQLLNKKIFLLTFIRCLESQRTFTIRDRANVASLLMIIYQNNLEYVTDILKALLVDLVQKSVAGRHPKLMLRRSESVVEKLLTNWLSLCLYKHLKEHAGASLFMLYKAIKLQVEKGPVDAVTGDARYSLSEDRLLREKIEPRSLTLNVEHGVEVVQLRVLDCDTIMQCKEKILDHLFKNIPYSQRPCMEDLELEWRNGPTGPLTLNDEDIASYNKDGWRRLNTLSFYKVHDGAFMSLLHRQHTYKTLNGTLDHALLMSMASQYPMKTDSDNNTRIWHLAKHDDGHVRDGGVKMISEIFLTRLLSTKGTLQKYVDDLFKTVLAAGNVPPIVKFLFDFLDQEAVRYGISDPEVVHTWKCNSLPLRFWVNIMKNPDFVFDINKPLIVDSCLSVVGQTFMDSCSTSEHRLGKDSPSNKLLFAKDIVHYRKLVEKYFSEIRDTPPISDQDISTYLADVSRMCSGKFYISSALRELYSFASKFSNELLEDLEQDNQANAQQMSAKLGHVITAMEGPSARMAYV
ncbi:plexin-B-like [Littorina saxatilis]|uniref:plexin-B-like n=1 Tax=Littorina saxatilis TaxID=31220 RepID=UPI0038B5FBD0